MRFIIIVLLGLLIWGVYNISTTNIKFSEDADIYDVFNKEEIYTIDSLADRGIKVQYDIRWIVIHTTGSSEGRPLTKAEVDRIFRERGWGNTWGYHYIINPNSEVLSSVTNLQPNYITPTQVRYGVSGYNAHSIHIAWTGGYNKKDTRTPAQKSKLIELITQMKKLYPKAVVKSHYQFPNVNKTCANFDAYEEYKNIK